MLARTVHSGEWFLVHQASHAVLLGDPPQRQHHHLLVIGREVCRLENRRDFKLTRCHFVVPRLDWNAELEQLAFRLQHEPQYPFRDGTEVVIVELLALRWLAPEQGTSRIEQVRSRVIEVTINQKVLLLRSCGRRDECARRGDQRASRFVEPGC